MGLVRRTSHKRAYLHEYRSSRVLLEAPDVLSIITAFVSTMSIIKGSTNIVSRNEEPLQQTFRSSDLVTGLQSATADQTLGQETTAVNNSMQIAGANGPYAGQLEQFLVSPDINAANKHPANTTNGSHRTALGMFASVPRSESRSSSSQLLVPNVALAEPNTAHSKANSSFLVTPGYRVTVFPWLR